MKLYLPFDGNVNLTSPFGYRTLNGQSDYHKGVDLVGADDITVRAPCDGVIGQSTMIPQSSGNLTWQWGNYVRLDTNDGLFIFMCHLAIRSVIAGQKVKRGDIIGVMGNTGYSFGAHTHFEVRNAKGESLNPCQFLGIENKVGIYKNQEDDMTKEEVLQIIKEYEEAKKTLPVPYAEDELYDAVDLKITDGTRPCEPTPRFQTAIMCKRVYHLCSNMITKLNAKIEKLSSEIGDLKAYGNKNE